MENKKEFKLISKKTPKSLLPNALTIFGVCLGLSSIKFALDLNYAMAIIAIGIAALLDTLDGRVARLIKGTSKVGKELDSLTDVISFGVAPHFIFNGEQNTNIFTKKNFNSKTLNYISFIRNRNLFKSSYFLYF